MRSALFVNSVFRKNLHLKNRLTFEVHLIFLFLFSSLYFWRSEPFLQPQGDGKKCFGMDKLNPKLYPVLREVKFVHSQKTFSFILQKLNSLSFFFRNLKKTQSSLFEFSVFWAFRTFFTAP